MANKREILAKVERNLEQIGITVSNDGSKLEAGNIKLQYQDAVIESPMGGVSDAASPFLGIGVANPGQLIVSGLLDADSAIADIFVTADDLRVMRVISGMANLILVKAGRTDDSILAADLAVIEGSSDLIGMGQ